MKSVETALLQCEVNGIYTNTVFGNSLPQPVPPQPVPPQHILVPPQHILVQSAPPPTPVNPLQVVPIPLVDSSQPVPVQPILVQPISPQHVPYPVDPVPPYPDPNVPVIMDNSSNQPNVDLAQLTPIRPIISPSFEIQEAQNLVCLNVDPENNDPAPAPAPFLIPVEPMEKNGNHTSSSMSHNSIPHSVLPIPLKESGIVSNTIPMEPTPVPTISMPLNEPMPMPLNEPIPMPLEEPMPMPLNEPVAMPMPLNEPMPMPLPLVQPVMPAVPTDAQHLPTMDTNDINFDMDEILRGITIDDNLLNTDITDPSMSLDEPMPMPLEEPMPMPLNEPVAMPPAPQPYQTDSSVYYPNNN